MKQGISLFLSIVLPWMPSSLAGSQEWPPIAGTVRATSTVHRGEVFKVTQAQAGRKTTHGNPPLAAVLARAFGAGLNVTDKGSTGPDSEAPPIWEAAYTATPPQIDGVADKVWLKSKPLTLVVRKALGGDRPRSVVLRALHTGNDLYVLAQWPDETASLLRDPYVWNAEKKLYERPSKPDDQFAIEFPMAGEFDIRMLTLTHQYTADVWHWKAGRGNPVGWADDKRHIISRDPVPGGVKYSMGGHGDVYIARPMDEGTPSYRLKPKPETHQGDIVDAFEHLEPSGSLADIHAKGVHDGRGWILEMSRKLNTGHADDAVIDPTRDNICAVAVLDDELYWEHSVSPEIILRFHGAAGAKASGGLYAGAPGKPPDNPGSTFGDRIPAEDSLRERSPATPPKRKASIHGQWDFEDAAAGTLPGYLDAPRGHWRVEEIPDAPAGRKALVQTAKSPRPYFNLAVIKKPEFRDVRLAVKLKALSGEIDQGGGLLWRYQDPDNYYVARVNSLENNFRLYRVVDGKREMLKSADISVPAQVWHTLEISVSEDEIACALNGREFLQVQDTTFLKEGLVGVWSKSDAHTVFDLLEVEPLDARVDRRR